jgi:cytochrome c biogenesis factor
MTTEVDTLDSPLQDLFVALTGFDDRGEEAVLKMVVNPLVIWLWVSALFVIGGTTLALLPRRRRTSADGPSAPAAAA